MLDRVDERRQVSPRQPEEPTPEAPVTVLALQRTAGNRAVAEAVRSGSLPSGVRARMERSFGSDFEDVRVREDSAEAAAIGARALTRGNEIHFAAGAYDPGSAQGDELIGHELAHVVQQRQGRAAPTHDAGGLELSIDPALEREADIHAARATRGESTGASPTTGRSGPAAAAQAKFGFEFQTDHSFIAHDEIKIIGEKSLAFEDKAKKFKVEGDEGRDDAHFDVEFITHALSTVKEAEIAVKGAAALAADLTKGDKLVTHKKGEDFDGGTWVKDAAIQIKDRGSKAQPQATVGVGLADIPKLMTDNLRIPAHLERLRRAEAQAQATLEGDILKAASPDLRGFLQMVVFYIDSARSKNDVDEEDDESFEELDDQVLETDGPKVNFPVMARTDFHSMYKTLPDTDKKLFLEGLIGSVESPRPDPAFEKHIGVALKEPIIRAPYRADRIAPEDKGRYKTKELVDRGGRKAVIMMESPSILDWLLSIVTGHRYQGATAYGEVAKNRDMLSAPVGWGSRKPEAKGFPESDEIVDEAIYGMGAYPMDDKLAVFELRNFRRNIGVEKPPAAEWWAAVEHAIKQEIRAGLPAGSGVT